MSQARMIHRGRRNRGRVHALQNQGCDWTGSPGVTEAELRAAFHVVGNSADKVWEYLKQQEQRKHRHRIE